MKNYVEIAKIFKALSDPNRIQILELLKAQERCACVLLEELNIVQSTLSHHMKLLCDANIVIPRKEGKWTHYSLNRENNLEVLKILENLLLEKNKTIID